MGDSKPDIPIPDGLQKLMQDFVVTVLRQQPEDVLTHAAEYFTKLKDVRDAQSDSIEESSSSVKFAVMDEETMDDEEIMRRMQEKQKYGRRKSVSAEGYDPDKDDDEENEEEKIIHPKTDLQEQDL